MKKTKRRIIWCISLCVMVAALCNLFKFAVNANKESVDEDLTEEKTLVKTIYTEEYQDEVEKRLATAKSTGKYTEESMLIEPDPYGTNALSLYVYFETETASKVSYTITSEDEDIDEFSATPESEQEYAAEHEFQVIGLVPDMKNTVTFTVSYQDGTEEEYTYTSAEVSASGEEETCLEVTEVEESASQQLSNGLYVILGNDSDDLDYMYYYDNQGILRGEIPLIGYRSHRLLFQDGLMYYSISETKIAAMNSLGKIEHVYDTGDYELHHDYVFDDENHMIILASDTKSDSVEDVILQMDLESGEIVGVLDLAELYGDYKQGCTENEDGELDWIHINTVQWIEDETLILSSRETSTIIKLQSAFTNPSVEYMIGSQSFWEGTGYEELLLEKDESNGEFSDTGGQHTVTYLEDDSLEDGQYYLYMFNNNMGVSESRESYDWNQIEGIETSMADGETSYYYKYLVDENKGTYSLVQSFEVPFSAYVSSSQEYEDNIIVDSGMAGIFSEYDDEGNLLVKYEMELSKAYIYRVYKYDFSEFFELE